MSLADGAMPLEKFLHRLGNSAVSTKGRSRLLRRPCNGIEVRAQKLFPNTSQYLRMHEICIVETHLNLCRMNVDVVILIRHLNKYKGGWESAGVNTAAIRLFNGVRNEFVSYESSVEEYVLKAIAGSGNRWLAEKAEYMQALFVAFGLKQFVSNIL
jgi:hypothetical protein